MSCEVKEWQNDEVTKWQKWRSDEVTKWLSDEGEGASRHRVEGRREEGMRGCYDGEAFRDGLEALPEEPAPYRGLERFEATHAEFFFA